MKFQFKAIVAALAMVAAGQAFAAIQPGTTAQGANGSELVFYAFDDAAKTSYVKDLGVTFASFIAAPTSLGSVNIGGDANWATYLTNVGNNTANTYWGVFATEKTSALAANGVNILTTARGNAPTATTTGNVRGIDGSFNTIYLGALQGTDATYAANLSYVYDLNTTSAANWANSMAHNLYGKVSFNADNLIGTSANFYRLSAAASASTNATLTTVLAAPTQLTFDGQNLSITAAVPEPETYSMLAAGLLMLGAVARRRKM
jgi:hypothetical protein